MKKKSWFSRTSLALGILFLLSATGIHAQTILRISHQWPGGTGDVRDEMFRIIARKIEAADVDITVRIYPAQSLFKAGDQWSALIKGRLDITALPLDYASGRHPQFNATLMPGLVKNHDHARRLNTSSYMETIKNIIHAEGIIVLADAWLSGGFVSTKNCILWPSDIQGQVTRGAGPAFERMLAGAGASIASMPSSEIYTALQTGVLDAANTSSASLVTFRLYEHARCLTAPGEHTLWFMYQPVLMAKSSWDNLNSEQQQTLYQAAKFAEDYFFQEAKKLDSVMEEVYRSAGVEIAHMTAEQAEAWKTIAAEHSYRVFAEEVLGGAELIDKALAIN
ncbi:MAG: TRAP transporter substrate-binding protein DctP [Gammaproteobacteria bacterium]